MQGEPKQKSKKQGGTWVCNEALYEWWKRKITEEVKAGGRYFFYYGVVLLWLEVWHIRAEDTERRLCVPGPFREPYRGRGQPFQPGRCERRSSGIERGRKRLSTIASREWIEDNTKVTIPANKRNYRKQKTM